MTVLLQGIVGSTAYGLAREGSDVDRLGVFAAPSDSFWGLNPPLGKAATIVQHGDEDLTLHELGKFCTLAIACNPHALELLWLPDDLYEVRAEEGYRLQYLRGAFLSRQRVRDAYFNYASQQFLRLQNKQRFPDVPVSRIEKHARHLRRLLHQGLEVYEHGTMSVHVTDPDEYFFFGQRVAAGEIDLAERLIDRFEEWFDTAQSPLPDVPDSAAVEDFLRSTRRALLS